MKDEVYSWRVANELKTDLEREARRRKLSLSAVLEAAAREWLKKSRADIEGDEAQRELQKAAGKCFGTLAGGDAHRAENARKVLRQRLKRRHDG